MQTEPETINAVMAALAPHDFTTRCRVLQFVNNWSNHAEEKDAADRNAKFTAEHQARADALADEKAAAEKAAAAEKSAGSP